uniref:Uncharacterized protein n=1 Tax=Avena sativa TaxID=4498 RepID=A0ACD5WLP6_AVESA
MWRLHTDPLRPWRRLDMQFTKHEREIFFASIAMVVSEGTTSLFWVNRWVDGKSIGEIAPDLLALIPRHFRKVRTVQQAVTDRSWISDISGAISPSRAVAVRATVEQAAGHASGRCARQAGLAVDDRWTVFIQVLLLSPLPGVYCLRFLEVDLEILGAAQGEVLHLARLSGQMLDRIWLYWTRSCCLYILREKWSKSNWRVTHICFWPLRLLFLSLVCYHVWSLNTSFFYFEGCTY